MIRPSILRAVRLIKQAVTSDSRMVQGRPETYYRAIGSPARTWQEEGQEPTPQLGYTRPPETPEFTQSGWFRPTGRKVFDGVTTGLDALWGRDVVHEMNQPIPTQKVTAPRATNPMGMFKKGPQLPYTPWKANPSRGFGPWGGVVNTPMYGMLSNYHRQQAFNPEVASLSRNLVHKPMMVADGASALASGLEMLRPNYLRWTRPLMACTAAADIALAYGQTEADAINRGAQNLQNQQDYFNDQQNAFLGLLNPRALEDRRMPSGAVPAYEYDPLKQKMYAVSSWFANNPPGTVNTDAADRKNYDTERSFGNNDMWTNLLAPGAKDTVYGVRRRNADARLREMEDNPDYQMSSEERNQIVYVPAQRTGRLVPMTAGDVYDQYTDMLRKQYQAQLPTTGSGYVGNARISGYINPAGENRLRDQMPESSLPVDPLYRNMQQVSSQLPREHTFDDPEMNEVWQQVWADKDAEAEQAAQIRAQDEAKRKKDEESVDRYMRWASMMP